MRLIILVLQWFWWSLPACCMSNSSLNSRTKRNVLDDHDKWFVQKLDHLNASDTRTWKQKYHINTEYYQKGGPVFLMLGGEGKITYDWVTKKYLPWIEYAKEFQALCLQLEHRFYGESHPITRPSIYELRYLSVKQALADVAEFIGFMELEHSLHNKSKWVTFGGSYAGQLAMLMRMQYPHLVYAAVSSSGALINRVEHHGYIRVVEKALSTYDSDCVIQIKRAVQDVIASFKTTRGADIIKDKFKLCNSPNKISETERRKLLVSVRKSFVYAVQNNDSSQFNIKYVCDIMMNNSIGKPLTRLKAITQKKLVRDKMFCLESNSEDEFGTIKLESSENSTIKNGEYFETVQKPLSNYNQECVIQIEKAEQAIILALDSIRGANIIKKIFNLCEKPNRSSEKSKQHFFNELSNFVFQAVQFNDDAKHTMNIKYVCSIMIDVSMGKPLDRLAKLNTINLNFNNETCLRYDYFYNKKDHHGNRLEWLYWYYQMCSEIGSFPTSNRVNDLFGQTIPLDYSEDYCTDTFGESFNFKNLEKRLEIINNLTIKSKENRIINVLGTFDPWYEQGLIKDDKDYVNTIFIEGASHCTDMISSKATFGLIMAHLQIKNYLVQWLNNDNGFIQRIKSSLINLILN